VFTTARKFQISNPKIQTSRKFQIRSTKRGWQESGVADSLERLKIGTWSLFGLSDLELETSAAELGIWAGPVYYQPVRHAAALILLLTIPMPAASAAEPNQGMPAMKRTEIVKEDYHGWPNTYRLSNGLIEARVVTDIGPRIMDLRPAGGANLLHAREGVGGSGEDRYMFRGGWRLWIAPERTETTYALDNSACQAELVDDTTLRVTAPPQAAAGIQKQIEVALKPGERRLRVTSRIKNVTDHPLTYAAWSLSVLEPGGRAFLPLDVGSLTAFDATRSLLLWSYARFADPRYHFGDALVQIDHARVKAAAATPGGGRGKDESKIGVDSAQGWQAYLLHGTLYLKRFPHDAAGQYPDGGATMEVYSNHDFLELEHLGPLTTIKPGEEIIFPEHWWVFSGVKVPADERDALTVLQRYVAQTSSP
jgi:hypothetical protein